MDKKEELKKVLKRIEPIAEMFINAGKLNSMTVHELLLYVISLDHQKQLLDDVYSNVPLQSELSIVKDNIVSFNKDKDGNTDKV